MEILPFMNILKYKKHMWNTVWNCVLRCLIQNNKFLLQKMLFYTRKYF